MAKPSSISRKASRAALSCALAMLAMPVLAAPAIQGVSGTLSSKSTVTVTGSSFGTHGDFGQTQPFLNAAWNDFSSGQINGGNFTLNGVNNSAFSLSAADARPHHAYALKRVFNGNELGTLEFTNFGTRNTWFTAFWFKLAPNTQSGKFWRLYGTPQSDNIYLSTGGYDTKVRGFSESQSISPAPQTDWGSGPTSIGYNVWRRVDILASNSPSSVFKVWIDGVLQFTKTNWVPATWSTSGHTLDVPNMLDDPARDGKGWNGAYFFSDLYYSYTQARVELGNAPTWAASTVREIQIPIAWSASSVSFTVNTGSFANGATAYLYVVDSAGNASAGYPVTIGSGVPAQPPPAPTNLRLVSP